MWGITITADEMGVLSAILAPLVVAIAFLFKTLMNSITTGRTEYTASIAALQKTHQDVTAANTKAFADALLRVEEVVEKRDQAAKERDEERERLLIEEIRKLKGGNYDRQ